MPDREKVIKVIEGLEHCIVDNNEPCNCPYDGDGGCIGSLMRDALALLKAQEAVEPTEPDEDNMRYCGACGSPVGYEVLEAPGIEYVQYSYCQNCGRKVRWE